MNWGESTIATNFFKFESQMLLEELESIKLICRGIQDCREEVRWDDVRNRTHLSDRLEVSHGGKCVCSTCGSFGNQNSVALRILGPSNGRVWTCIAGVRVLKIVIFEGSGFLGWKVWNFLLTCVSYSFVMNRKLETFRTMIQVELCDDRIGSWHYGIIFSGFDSSNVVFGVWMILHNLEKSLPMSQVLRRLYLFFKKWCSGTMSQSPDCWLVFVQLPMLGSTHQDHQDSTGTVTWILTSYIGDTWPVGMEAIWPHWEKDIWTTGLGRVGCFPVVFKTNHESPRVAKGNKPPRFVSTEFLLIIWLKFVKSTKKIHVSLVRHSQCLGCKIPSKSGRFVIHWGLWLRQISNGHLFGKKNQPTQHVPAILKDGYCTPFGIVTFRSSSKTMPKTTGQGHALWCVM